MAVLTETVTIPIWAAVVAAVAAVTFAVLVRRLEAKHHLAAVVGLALLAAFAISLPTSFQTTGKPSDRDATAAAGGAAERRALDARRAELTARATEPGLPLACVNGLAGEPVETACERAVFASPTSIAAAVTYAAAQLQLLADGVGYARRFDPSYAADLAALRRAAENDAYGIFAHVLATRDACTPERCAAFALLRDPSTLKVHLRQRAYATYIAQHRDRWGPVTAARAATPIAIAPHPSAYDMATAALAATTALAPPPTTPPMAAGPTPFPKVRPAAPATIELSAATPAAIENPAANKPTIGNPATEMPPTERPASGRAVAATPVIASPAAAVTPPSRSGRSVPPVASVLPNLDFPSSSSIPPVSIIAAEPQLPVDDAKPARPAATPKRSSSRPQ
jgi:hypothetical protein